MEDPSLESNLDKEIFKFGRFLALLPRRERKEKANKWTCAIGFLLSGWMLHNFKDQIEVALLRVARWL